MKINQTISVNGKPDEQSKNRRGNRYRGREIGIDTCFRVSKNGFWTVAGGRSGPVGHRVRARPHVERPAVCGLTDGALGIKLKYR